MKKPRALAYVIWRVQVLFVLRAPAGQTDAFAVLVLEHVGEVAELVRGKRVYDRAQEQQRGPKIERLRGDPVLEFGCHRRQVVVLITLQRRWEHAGRRCLGGRRVSRVKNEGQQQQGPVTTQASPAQPSNDCKPRHGVGL